MTEETFFQGASEEELKKFLADVPGTLTPLPDEHFDYVDSLTEMQNSFRAWGKVAALNVIGRMQEAYAADHDPLTGLLNRRGIGKKIDAMLAQSHEVGFLLLDADGFKDINDKHGHDRGDQELITLGNLLSSTLRKTDLVEQATSRYGGDEFLVVADLTPTENDARGRKNLSPEQRLVKVVKRIQAAMREASNKGQILTTLSIGAGVLRPGMDIKRVIKNADDAMYKNKLAKVWSVNES